MSTHIRQVVELPLEEYQSMKQTQERILKVLENLKIVAPTEYVTLIEFMIETKMSRWKADVLRQCGKLKIIQRGRKLYLPRTEIQRYFNGEMEG